VNSFIMNLAKVTPTRLIYLLATLSTSQQTVKDGFVSKSPQLSLCSYIDTVEMSKLVTTVPCHKILGSKMLGSYYFNCQNFYTKDLIRHIFLPPKFFAIW